jgi:MFS superfamily sulfate permease-like transporter
VRNPGGIAPQKAVPFFIEFRIGPPGIPCAVGGTRVQISGPTGAFIAVLAIITAQHGIAGLQIATLMAGVILVAFGFARLGAVIKYIPNPVIVGFTAGIGVIIFVGQWKDFLGLTPGPAGLHFHEKLWSLIEALPSISFATTGLALLSLAILTIGARYLKRLPAPLVATTLILRMGSVPFIDATGINALEEMVGDFKRHGASVLLVELRPNVRYKLERAGVIAQIGEEHIIDTLDDALQLAKRYTRAAAPKPPVDV